MAQTIKLKRSASAGAIPSTSDLALGEIAINTADGAVYIKKGNDDIVAVHDNDILHIDTTNSRVGIGTTSPSYALDVAGKIKSSDRVLSNVYQSISSYGMAWKNSAGSDNMFLSNGGNLGIGTTSPGRQLHVQMPNLSAGTGNGIRITDDSAVMEVGLRKDGSGNRRLAIFEDGGTYPLVLQEDGGNVGIGTDSPSEKLHVAGTSDFLVDLDGSDSAAIFKESGGNSWRIGNDSSLDAFAITQSETSLGTNVRLLIANGGNVGIGTTNPDKLLTVSGADAEISINDTSNTPLIRFRESGTSAALIKTNSGKLVFTTRPSGGSLTDVGAFDTDGKFGIGTTSPANKLDVRISNNAEYSTTETSELNPVGTDALYLFNEETTSTNGKVSILMRDTGSGGGAAGRITLVNDRAGDGSFAFLLRDSAHTGEQQEKMRITSDGYLGIGTASPSYYLDVNPGSNTQAHARLKGGHATMILDRGSTSYDSNLSFLTGGVTKWRLWNDGSDNTLQIRDEANAANVMTWETGGNVGIGTSSPSGLFSLEKGTRTLDVKLETTPASGDVGVQFRAGASDFLGLAAGGGSGTGIVIDDSNRVGIGTSSLTNKFHVNGNARIEGSLMAGGASATNVPARPIHIKSSGDAAAIRIEDTTSSNLAYDIRSTHGTGLLFVDVTGSATRMTIADDGNVGIGTTSPDAKLEVAGGSTGIVLSNAGDSSAYDQVAMTYSGYNSGSPEFIFQPKTAPGSGTVNTSFRFKTKGGGGNNVANVTIDGALTVGNAYTFPTSDGSANQVLQTDGSGNLSFAAVSGGGGVTISNNANNRVLTGDGTNANAEANLTFDGSTLDITGSITTDGITSSAAYKSSGGDTGGSGQLINVGGDAVNQSNSGTIRFTEKTYDVSPYYQGGYIKYDGSANQFKIGTHHASTNALSDDIDHMVLARSTPTVDFQGAIQSGGTTIVDTSRNLTNIGTISSGAITSSGEVEATALDINGNGDISGNLTLGGYLAGPASFTIDPAAVGDNTGTVVIAGNLQVDGTTTTINSTTLTVDDKNITLASGSSNSSAANGAGLTVDCGSDTDTTFTYNGTSAQWETNTELVIKPRHTSGTPPTLTLSDLNNQYQSGIASSGHLTMRAGGSGNLYWQNSGTYLMTLSSGGNLSIGNGATAGSEVLDVTGNIAVSGTVDGRDIATDGTKLDGIEANATADQTASEILTAIKTVDGSGSGLDADLLDGINSGSFLRSDANDTFTGSLTIDSGTSMGLRIEHDTFGQCLELHREDTSNAASIKFSNNSGTSGVLFAIHSETDLFWRKGTGTTNYRIWTEENDGSGSGLDADKLDGLQSGSFLRSDANDSYSGVLSLTGELTLASGSTRIDGSDGHPLVQVNSSRAYFGSTNRAVSTIATNSTTGLKANVSGTDYTVFHAGNSAQFTSALNTKLSGIETGATADQTQAEINALGITATGLSGTPNITVGTLNATEFAGHIEAGGHLDFNIGINHGTTGNPDRWWISQHSTGQSDVPGSYYDIINLSSSTTHGVQIASNYGATSGQIYMRTRSDNNNSPSGAGLQGWKRLYHQDYHPEADTLTTARTIGGVSFDGSANINLPGVNTAGNQNTSGTAAGLSGTPNISVGTLESTGNVTHNITATQEVMVKVTNDSGARNALTLNHEHDRDIGIHYHTSGGDYEVWMDSAGDDSLIFSPGTAGNPALELYQSKAAQFYGEVKVPVDGTNFILNSDTTSREAIDFRQSDVQKWTLDINANGDLNFVPKDGDLLKYNGNELATKSYVTGLGFLTSSSNLNASNLSSGTIPSARFPDNIFDSYRRDTIDSSSEDFDSFLTTGTYHVNNWSESGDVVQNGPTGSYPWGLLRVTNWQAASGSSSGTGTYVLQEYFPHNTDTCWTRIMWNGSFTGWRESWGSGSDGSGSGLDADLLDGVQGSSYLRSDADDTASGNITITGSGNKALTVGNGSARREIKINSSQWPEVTFYNNSTENVRIGSAQASGTYNTTEGDFYVYAPSTNTMNLIVPEDGGSFTRDNGAYTVWDSGNDGSGSGLDADKLDGQQGSSYLRSDANDDFSGTLNYTPDTGDVLNFDGQSVIRRMSANGGLAIGHDDALILTAGEASTPLRNTSNVAPGTETIFMGAEGGVVMYAFPNNDVTWSNRKTFSFDGTNGFKVGSVAQIDINGNLTAVTKSFDIPHPSKDGMRLRHGVLEGPENGVYVRGKSQEKVISLPEYWPDLIHEDSITVQLTAIGSGQELYVEKIEDNKVYVNGENYFYYIQAERKDVERFEVEYSE